jgi:16S rRNA (adenine(1408)-N(1))-methyltransferase
VRVLQGTRVVEAAADWRESVGRWTRVVVDLGSGDGRFPYTLARADPPTLYIGVDPDPAALSTYAFRASRKPARGGITNVIYVVAPVEALPVELAAIADLVHVIFPWGGLLRGLLLPEAATLDALASVGKNGARYEVILSYDPAHDSAVAGDEALPPLDEQRIDLVLAPAYAAHCLPIVDRRRVGRDQALALPSTWGRRLLHGRRRDVFALELRRG